LESLARGNFANRAAVSSERWYAAEYRLLGFFDGPVLLILTSGFVKKQQKTPQKEIELAQRRRTEYLERKGKP